MLANGYGGDSAAAGQKKNVQNDDVKPTYALEHLATFKIKNKAEIHNPKEKMKVLMELDKSGGVWPQKMYMSFNGQWLLMLDSDMNEIENFPGSLITEPTAFISDDPQEAVNNILIFTVPGISLSNTEMHIFQVSDVSAVLLVEDLRELSNGRIVRVDRNKTPIQVPKPVKPTTGGRDQYGLTGATVKNTEDQQQLERDILVINHCFEDIERFVARLQYAAEAIRELELRQNLHNPHGEGLLVLRSRPPIETEFQDILRKLKLALNYIVKLQTHFKDVGDPIANTFVSLHTIVKICNEVHPDKNIPLRIKNPLLKRETVTMLTACLSGKDLLFWRSLGENWTLPKDQFKDHKGSFHPIFYDDWSPSWVVDEDVAYKPPVVKKEAQSPKPSNHAVWLTRLESRNVMIARVHFSKIANNNKELTVAEGEYLEILDDTRKWWKARNSAGSIGYVPHTILVPHNFNPQYSGNERDTDSLSSSILDHDQNNNNNNNNIYRNSVYAATPFVTANEFGSQPKTPPTSSKATPRAYVAAVPAPPPLPPPDSQPSTPSDTMKRNMATAGAITAMRARNDDEVKDEALMLQGTFNDELKYTLQQREQRRDLEILTTPQVYINQNSSPREVEEWLRCKGFSNVIVKRLGGLKGSELFALSPHTIESYFGQQESRRLISQIVLQKTICEFKTIRSSELSAKLAKRKQQIDQTSNDSNELF